jgi:Kef-type K+ transport system membrane component KefB
LSWARLAPAAIALALAATIAHAGAGIADAGPAAPAVLDAGIRIHPGEMIDAGTLSDAGAPIDARPARRRRPDAATPSDAGVPTAAIDAAIDAAPDAGVADAAIVDAGIAPDAAGPASSDEPAVLPELAETDTGPPPTTAETTENTFTAIKVIAGLLALLVLAYLGGDPRVVRFQERLGLGGVITAGFPFVALGLIAALPSVGILNEEVLSRLRPVMHFGLGWLGFIIGAQLDIRVLDRVPKGTAYLILVESLGPFGITVAGCGAVMLAFGASPDDPAAWRALILLGAAAAMTAPRKFRGFANRTWREGRGVDVLLGQLDELVGVIGLLFITAYFREPWNTSWQLPSTAWIFVSLGVGVTIGVLIFAMIRVPRSNVEFLAVVLGSIAFASGLAGYLRLSPIVVCFLAGVLVTNFPNDQRASLFRILAHLERPVQLLFLVVAGAVWDVGDWRGWALVPLFVLARIVGKWSGIIASRTVLGAALPSSFADKRPLIVPVSSLSIALVISVESLYRDSSLPWVITAVIGGAVVTELLVQRMNRGADSEPEPERPVPIDELDDDTSPTNGPIYRDDDPSDRGPR